MNARQKLNSINVSGAVFLAAVLGGVFESWAIFLITLTVLIAGAIYCGDVRPDRRWRR